MIYQLTTIAPGNYNLTCNSADLESLRRNAAGWLENYGYLSMLSPVLPDLADILADWEKSHPAPIAPPINIEKTAPAEMSNDELRAELADFAGITPPDVPGRWIPKGFDCRCNEFGVVYFTEFPKPVAIGYRGKSKKTVFHYRYSTVERMHEAIAAYLDGLARLYAEKKAAQAKRKAFDARDHWHVGDIIYDSWGYDQTNIDFYQVVAVTAKFVTVRPIAGATCPELQGTHDSAYCVAVPNKFKGPAKRCGATSPDYTTCGSRYDGKPLHYSWGH